MQRHHGSAAKVIRERRKTKRLQEVHPHLRVRVVVGGDKIPDGGPRLVSERLVWRNIGAHQHFIAEPSTVEVAEGRAEDTCHSSTRNSACRKLGTYLRPSMLEVNLDERILRHHLEDDGIDDAEAADPDPYRIEHIVVGEKACVWAPVLQCRHQRRKAKRTVGRCYPNLLACRAYQMDCADPLGKHGRCEVSAMSPRRGGAEYRLPRPVTHRCNRKSAGAQVRKQLLDLDASLDVNEVSTCCACVACA